MTPKEAFKVGFMHKCAEDGLSPEETMARIRHSKLLLKEGFQILGTDIPNPANAIPVKTLMMLGLIAPPVAGMAGGYALSQMQDDTYDEDEMRTREEIAEHQRALDRMQRLHNKLQPAGPN